MKKRGIMLSLTAFLGAASLLAGCAEREEAGNRIVINESADNDSGGLDGAARSIWPGKLRG